MNGNARLEVSVNDPLGLLFRRLLSTKHIKNKIMIDWKLIINIVIGLFFYNIILKAFGNVLMNQFMKNDEAKKMKKTFRERMSEELKEKG